MQWFLKGLFAYSLFVVGALLFYSFTVKSLRDGRAKTRYGGDFNRGTDSFGFWLVVVFGVVGGLFGCGMAIFILVHPLPIKL
jgi:hypothetical protein